MPDESRMEKRQRVLANFGEFALRSDDLDAVLTEACRLVADALGTGRAKVLEITDEGQPLLVRAAIGWDRHVVGRLRLPMAAVWSKADFIVAGDPVIVDDLASEDRFDCLAFLKEAGIKALANVPIFLPGGRPFGLLQVDASEPRAFSDEDTQFLRTYATILGPVIGRLLTVQALGATEERLRTIVEAARDYAIFQTDPQDRITDWLPGAEAVFGWTAEEAVGQSAAILFTPEDRRAGIPEAEMSGARANGSAPDVRWHLRKDGSRVFIEGSVVALRDGTGTLRGFQKIGQDVTKRHLAEETLRAGEERLRDVLNSMAEGFALLGPDFTILEVNEETVRLDGRHRDELVGRSHWDAFPGTQHSPVGALFVQVTRDRRPAALEHRYVWPDGRDLWLDMRVYPTPGGGVAIFWRDITDRKHADDALRTSEQRYRTLFETMDEAYAVVEVLKGRDGAWADFRFIEVNPAFLVHTSMPYPVGKTATELLGTPNPRWARMYGQALDTGEALRVEETEPTLDRIFDLNIFCLDRPRNRVAVLFTNITKRKAAEMALRRSEAHLEAELRYTTLLRDLAARLVTAESATAIHEEVLSTAVAITASDAGTVQIYDPETASLVILVTTGLPRAMLDHFHRVDAASSTACGIALRTGRRTFVDFDNDPSDDDHRLHVEAGLRSAQATPLLSRDGSPIGMLNTHWKVSGHRPGEAQLRYLDLLARQAADLIEQRRAEASLRESRDAAEAANREKSRFLASVSHDLRQPVMAAILFLDVLTKSTLGKAERELVDALVLSLNSLTGMLNGLLEVARLDAGIVEVDVLDFELDDLLHRLHNEFRGLAREARLRLHMPPASCIVRSDPLLVELILRNLLSNALKFTETGGISVEARVEGTAVTIEVGDTGLGIAADDLGRIFDEYFQAGNTARHHSRGFGIGLATVRRVAALLGTAVTVRSEPGQGSTFTLRLPLAVEPAAMATLGAAEEPEGEFGWDESCGTLKGRTALVVDDEPLVLRSLELLLGTLGIETHAARTLAQAEAILDGLDRAPDIVISDYTLARGERGTDAIASARRRGTPIAVLVTGDTSPARLAEAQGSGAQLLHKPIDPGALEDLLAEAVASL